MEKERDILQQKLGNYAPEPSHDLWPGIEARLKPRRKFPLWIWMAAAIAIFLMAVWLWPREDIRTPAVVDNQSVPVQPRDSQQFPPVTPPDMEPAPALAEEIVPETESTPTSAPAHKEPSSQLKPVRQLIQPVQKAPRTWQASQRPEAPEPSPVQRAANRAEDARPVAKTLLATNLDPVDPVEGEAVRPDLHKPRKVVVIRKAKPQESAPRTRSFELNIGNTRILRISRKRSTTEHSTS